jgi:cell division septal protein FtsQ
MKKSQLRYSRGYIPERYSRKDRRGTTSFRGKAIIFLWSLFLILVLAYVLLLSPIFEIKEIKVSGNRAISSEEIRNSLNNQTNLFLATENKLRGILITDFPRILSLEVQKNIFKKTIDIKIIERREAGIFCGNECYYIDKDGVIFEKAPQTSGTLILAIKDNSAREVEIGKNALNKEFMGALINLREDLLNQLGLKALDFIIESNVMKDLRVNTNEGWYILFDRNRDLKNQLQALILALEEKIKESRKNLEYVDLRIENRVYYK